MTDGALKKLDRLLSAKDKKGNPIFPWPTRFRIRYTATELRNGHNPFPCVRCGWVATFRLVFPLGLGTFDLCTNDHQRLLP